jgi:hypothetical protein
VMLPPTMSSLSTVAKYTRSCAVRLLCSGAFYRRSTIKAKFCIFPRLSRGKSVTSCVVADNFIRALDQRQPIALSTRKRFDERFAHPG